MNRIIIPDGIGRIQRMRHGSTFSTLHSDHGRGSPSWIAYHAVVQGVIDGDADDIEVFNQETLQYLQVTLAAMQKTNAVMSLARAKELVTSSRVHHSKVAVNDPSERFFASMGQKQAMASNYGMPSMNAIVIVQ